MDDVVAVVTDLFFQSRVASAARAAGRPLRLVTAPDGLQAISWSLALVDLDAQLDVLDAIRTLRAGSGGPIVAFGPHVDTEGRKAARAAGADRVLAKSRFVAVLPDLMRDAGTLPEV